MENILKLNAVSHLVDDVLGKNYIVCDNAENPVAILVRSFDMHDYALPESVLAVARAGAGVNNIPFEDYAKKGVVVFNTPGANSNAVNELVITALLLSSRNVISAVNWVQTLKGTENISKQVEKGKKNFVGKELSGKKLGIIGLGAIGAKVANTAVSLGMEVLGYDPYLSVYHALHLSRHVEVTNNIDDIYKTCDYITIHVPFTEQNKHMINASKIEKMKDDVVIINCARGELVDNSAIIDALNSNKIAKYVTDFPCEELIGVDNVLCIPHLGASTLEAEDNCAIMASKELKDYIENGNISNSVNMPNCSAPRSSNVRIAIIHKNQQNMIAQFTTILAEKGINIDNFQNSSRGDMAYSIIDIPEIDENSLKAFNEIDGIIKIRKIISIFFITITPKN